MSYQSIRLRALDDSIATVRNTPQLRRGWLRAVREALELSLEEVSKKTSMSRQNINQLEQSEASGKITLDSLRRLADAMDCNLVYAIVPRDKTFAALANQVARRKSQLKEDRARRRATKLIEAVDQTMALEGQSTGRTKERVEEETQRLLGKKQ
jgi:predicted DNA-binding mobile mystery protein A